MSNMNLGFLVADVARLSRRAFQKSLEGSSLTLAQARVLLRVSCNEGVRQVELADLLEVQPITLARQIDQLAEKGLVERRTDSTDRRAYRIFLTAAAQPQLAAIGDVTKLVQEHAMQGFEAHEVELVFTALTRMHENLGLEETTDSGVHAQVM